MDPSSAFRRLVPVSRLGRWVTGTEDVYVVAHMGIAWVDLERWRLQVDGLVERPFRLDYQELTSLPSHEVTAVLECFGNPLEPDVPTRRVGNVVWQGARLADALARARVRPGADAVWLEGLDWGTFGGVRSDRYLKDLPLDRALEDDVLLAWGMNGEALTAEHGFPVRVFVPGYFGTNAVKWLSRVQVARGRPEGLYTTRLYNREADGLKAPVAVRELDVNSVLVVPSDGTALACGRHAICGWAWSAWDVTRVEVSTDRGMSWLDARLEPRRSGHTWQRFTLDWPAEVPGAYQIASRATDVRGRTQPVAGRNSVHTVAVTVAT